MIHFLHFMFRGLFWLAVYAPLIFFLILKLLSGIKKQELKITKWTLILFLGWPVYILFFLSMVSLFGVFDGYASLGLLKGAEIVVYVRKTIFALVFVLSIISIFFYFSRRKETAKLLAFLVVWCLLWYIPSYFVASYAVDRIDVELQSKITPSD